MENNDNITQLTNVLEFDVKKTKLMEDISSIKEGTEKCLNSITGLSKDKDLMMERVNKYSVKELQSLSDAQINKLFVDDDGNELDIDVDIDPDKKQQFKRDLIIYLRASEEALDKIDKEYEILEQAQAECDIEIKEACAILSDKVIGFIKHNKQQIIESDDPDKEKKLKTIKYIESGYTLEIFFEIIEKYPSIIKNTLSEMEDEYKVSSMGERYTSKLKSNNVPATLFAFLSKQGDKVVRSVEEMFLLPGQYVKPDFFVYSLIRYFAMANWNDYNIKKAHSSVVVFLKKLYTDDFDEDVKKDYLNKIVEYLNKFN